MSVLQRRSYYGLRPGEPGGPQPQWIAVFNLPYSLLFRSRCGRIDYLSIIRRFIYLYTVKGHAIKYSFFICSNWNEAIVRALIILCAKLHYILLAKWPNSPPPQAQAVEQKHCPGPLINYNVVFWPSEFCKISSQSLGNGISESQDSNIFQVSPGPLENLCIYGARLVHLALLLGGGFENFEPGPPDITLRHWHTGFMYMYMSVYSTYMHDHTHECTAEA
jgi:hypothetical protein